MSARRECPTGCARAAREGHLMCGPCWAQVPPAQQRDVLRTWRAWRDDLANPALFRAYGEAADAAIASIP